MIDYTDLRDNLRRLNEINSNRVRLREVVFSELSFQDKVAVSFMHYHEKNPEVYSHLKFESFSNQCKVAPVLLYENALLLFKQGALDIHMVEFMAKKKEIQMSSPEQREEIFKQVAPDYRFDGKMQGHIFSQLLQEGKLNHYIINEVDRQKEMDMKSSEMWRDNNRAGLSEEALKIIYQYRHDPDLIIQKLEEKAEQFLRRAIEKNDVNAEIEYEQLNLAIKQKSVEFQKDMITGEEPLYIKELEKHQLDREMENNKIDLHLGDSTQDFSETHEFQGMDHV